MNSGWRTEWIEGSHEGCGRPPIFPTPNDLVKARKIEKTSQDDRSAPVQIHPNWLCPRRKGSVPAQDDQQGPQDVLQGRRTFCKAAGRSDLTSCVPAWPKSSESLRILALEKYPKEKSMIGSNKEARSSAQSLVHALVELVGKDELQFGQFDHLVMDLAEAPIRTFAGRSGTRPDQSVWYGRKSEPRLGRLERPDLQTGLIPWTGAHPKGK
ncbi:hypothetical protein F2Q68_00015697 [Brassica cretica]|uniref:Uncharacterized protein n=2 Tax=Brassica cretica TaxID=69181 RepID=A0ABQ7EY73_BRACR|nr:hypothetical protein F2Q68_00015697 [Brassica cretica]KAF3607940.1 hypothetical protein DY000_02048283 [Brassica cretica]